jgi:hypothetical protein
MSGLEVVGVVLGALPIMLKTVEGYKQGASRFKRWQNFQGDIRALVHEIEIQKEMFEGVCLRILDYTDLSDEERASLMTGQDKSEWGRPEIKQSLIDRLQSARSYDNCEYLLGDIAGQFKSLQAMLSSKDGSVRIALNLLPVSWLESWLR